MGEIQKEKEQKDKEGKKRMMGDTESREQRSSYR